MFGLFNHDIMVFSYNNNVIILLRCKLDACLIQFSPFIQSSIISSSIRFWHKLKNIFFMIMSKMLKKWQTDGHLEPTENPKWSIKPTLQTQRSTRKRVLRVRSDYSLWCWLQCKISFSKIKIFPVIFRLSVLNMNNLELDFGSMNLEF